MSGAPTIEGYEGFHPIGSGGFSNVFRARQVRYDRWVAVKVLHASDLDAATRRRFERECQLTGRLTGHPHIVTALDSGFTAGGHPFLTTDYYAKGSLADLMVAAGPLDVPNTLEVGVKVAGALETAHRAGVLHRDVKPQNILVSAFGEPALSDFGISLAVLRNESSTRAALTPLHAPPEVIDGDTSHPSSDVYSLGSTLYCLLAGRAPFATVNTDTETEGIFQVLHRVMTEPVPPIDRDDVPPEVHHALARAMAKETGDRFATPLAFGEALQATQRTMGMTPTPIVCPPPDEAIGPDDLGPPVQGGDAPAGLVEIHLRETGDGGGRLLVTFDEAVGSPESKAPLPERIVVDLTHDPDDDLTVDGLGPHL
jgi:serine/threonine protein kinase